MKLRCTEVLTKKTCLSIICGLLALTLSSCNEETASAPQETTGAATTTETHPQPSAEQAVAEQPSPEPEKAEQANPEADAQEESAEEEEAIDTREQIYDILVYQVAPAVAAPNSPVSSQIREVLRLLNKQYEQEKEALAGTPERTRLAVVIANMRCSFGAWDAALADYDRALADFNAMTEEDKADNVHISWLSIIYKGKAACFLNKKEPQKAIEQLILRRELNEKVLSTYPELKPGINVSMEIVPFATDLIATLRDHATCVALTNRNEAQTFYEEAITRATQLTMLPSLQVHDQYTGLPVHDEYTSLPVHNQYILLLADAANNATQNNDSQKAMQHLYTLAKHCADIHNQSRDEGVRKIMLTYAQTAMEAYKKHKEGQKPHEITTEPLNPDLPPLPNDSAIPAAVDNAAPETATVSQTSEVKAEPTPKKSTSKKNKRKHRKK